MFRLLGLLVLAIVAGCTSEPTEAEVQLSHACQLFIVFPVSDGGDGRSSKLACDCAVERLSKKVDQTQIVATTEATIAGFMPFLELAMSDELNIEDLSSIPEPERANMILLNALGAEIAACEVDLDLEPLEF